MKDTDLIDDNQYPDFLQQIENFKKFSKDVGQSVKKNSSVLASKEDVEHRMKTCIQCQHFDKQQKRCYMCGCFMEHKIKFTAAECPLSKW